MGNRPLFNRPSLRQGFGIASGQESKADLRGAPVALVVGGGAPLMPRVATLTGAPGCQSRLAAQLAKLSSLGGLERR
jgi:hypothetical protein